MYLFFDTETAGLPRNRKAPVSDLNNWPRLVQIAWLQYDNSGNPVKGSDYIIKPEGFPVKGSDYIIKPEGFTIPYNSTKIHGITTKKAMEEGVLLDVVLEEFSTVIDRSDYLVAHNMDFDEKKIFPIVFFKHPVFAQ
jgi:DNA polymerase III epsilon subunit-like protein